jgi:hypothetical protein
MSVKKISITVRMVGESFEVTWTVLDNDNSAPIVGAIVTCGGGSDDTDASGKAILAGFKDGTYSFTVSHPNYDTFTGSFSCS